MTVLIWGGALVTLAGVAGLVWSVIAVASARRKGLDDEGLRKRLQEIIPVNLGALALSVVGLMAVILGLSLG